MLQHDTKKLLKTPLLILTCLGAFSACGVSGIFDGLDDDDASGTASVGQAFSFTLEVVSQSRIDLRGINGPIDIVGVPGALQAEIWGERRVTSRTPEDARNYLRYLEVQVSAGVASNVISVKTVQPSETHGRTLEVTYHLRLPSRLEAIISNVNGNVLVDSLAAPVSVAAVNANVRVSESSGNATVSVTNGNVSLANLTHSTSTQVSVVNGSILAGLALPPRAACVLQTVNGPINLHIPQNTSAAFSAEVANGTISLTQLDLQDAMTTVKTVRGRLGSGEGQITLKTVNGSIYAAGF